MEKRIAEALPPDEAGRVNLLALLDPAIDTFKGTPRIQNGTLVSASDADLVIEFPYVPPLEYDYTVVFIATDTGGLVQALQAHGHQFEWMLAGYEGKWCWFEKAEGNSFGRAAGKYADRWLVAGQRYTSLVKVRDDKVEAFLDGKLIASYNTDYHEMGLNGDFSLRRKDTIGLRTWKQNITIESAYIVEITGQGTLLRPRRKR